MKYALYLAEDGRVLSATFEQYAQKDALLTESLPEGDISDYRYADGVFIHDPLPRQNQDEPTQLDRFEAQLIYTAMMTDTLLEE